MWSSSSCSSSSPPLSPVPLKTCTEPCAWVRLPHRHPPRRLLYLARPSSPASLPSLPILPCVPLCSRLLQLFLQMGNQCFLAVADLASLSTKGSSSREGLCLGTPPPSHLQGLHHCPAHILPSPVSPLPSVAFPLSGFASPIAHSLCLSFSVSLSSFYFSLCL